jgi:hypothetical protein
VIQMYLSRLVPGRFEACRDLAVGAFDFLKRRGTTNCRWLQLDAAGTSNEAMLVTWEFENMQASGHGDRRVLEDPERPPMMEVLMGPDKCAVAALERDLPRPAHVAERPDEGIGPRVDPPSPRRDELPAPDSAVEAMVTPFWRPPPLRS